MELSRLPVSSKDLYFYVVIAAAIMAFGVVGVQFGFLIAFGVLFAILTAVAVLLNVKIGLVLLLCSYFYVRPLYYLPVSLLTYIRLDDMLWGLVVISWLLNLRKTRTGSLRALPLFAPLVILCVIAALSGIRVFLLSSSFTAWGNFLWFLIRLLEYVSVYFVVGTVDFTDKERETLFNVMILCGAVVALVIFLQYLGILQHLLSPVVYIAGSGGMWGTFSFKTQAGAVAMILALLALDKTVRHRWTPWVGLLLLACFSLMLLVTQSRSAWVAFAVGLIVYLFSMRSLRSKILWSTLLIMAVALFFGLESTRELYSAHPILDPLTGRLSQDEAVAARLTSLPLIFQYLVAHPDVIFLGVGFMNWRYTVYSTSTIYFGHNNYISALVELGLPGLFAFCYFLFRSLLTAWRGTRRRQALSSFFLAMVAGLAAACFFEDIFWPAVAQESFLAFFMFIAALSLPPMAAHTGLSADGER